MSYYPPRNIYAPQYNHPVPTSSSKPKQKTRITYAVQSNVGQRQKHCFGVNSLAFSSEEGVLYTAGRDSTIHSWNILEKEIPTHHKAFEHHTDWVNKIILCKDTSTLISCSSDTSIKFWDTKSSNGNCIRTLCRHSDYVKSLAYSPHSNTLCSAGLDGNIYLWDILQCMEPVTTLKINFTDPHTQITPKAHAAGDQESFYSLAMSLSGNVLVSGSTSRVVRGWDSRSGEKVFKLKGHQDNIKALVLNAEGTLCISGSTDYTFRLWDIGTQRCINTYELHDDSVWSLSTDPIFSTVYSGGRDGQIFSTSLSSGKSTLLASEPNPILDLLYTPRDGKNGKSSLWVSTSDPTVHKWVIEDFETPKKVPFILHTLSTSPMTITYTPAHSETAPRPSLIAPDLIIPGRPGIVKHHILNNRRQVLTRDNVGVVELWDITKCERVAEYGVVNFDEKVEELNEVISIPSWFTVDTKTGSLSVTLDYPQCFTADIYATDHAFETTDPDLVMNLGERMLQALLGGWAKGRKERKIPNFFGDKTPLDKDGNEKDTEKSKEKEKEKDSHKPKSPRNKSPKQSPKASNSTHNENTTDSQHDQQENIPPLSLPLQSSSNVSNPNNSTNINANNSNPNSTSSANLLPPTIIPSFTVPPDTSILITEETTGATIYRSLVKDFDGNEPDSIIPYWVNECLIVGSIPPKDNGQKIGFFLVSFDESTFPPLPHGNTKLNAPKLLRVKKIAAYVANKLDLELPTRNSTDQKSENETEEDIVSPEEYLEILCNGKVLPPAMNLQTTKAFFWRSADELMLQYRVSQKYLGDSESSNSSNGENPSKSFKERLKLKRGKAKVVNK